jgi:gliding motility-associated-like protein
VWRVIIKIHNQVLMLNRYRYRVIFIMLICFTITAAGQMTMPDNACTGETRHYFVFPNPGSTYIWRVNGVIQTDFTSYEFEKTWSVADTFLLEVQEITFEGCSGPVRSGQVFVCSENKMLPIIHEAFSPNGDLVNDVWNIGNSELYPEMEVTIYNRWGQPVWKSAKGYPVPWDGKSKGALLPVDSYHYVIDLHNAGRLIVGSVTIVR